MHPSRSLLLPLLLGTAGVAHAQTIPDAGSVLQQIQGGQPAVLPRREPPQQSVAPPALEGLQGPAVTVGRFVFRGNVLLDDAALRAAVTPFTGRPLDFAELQRAAAAVADAYRRAGWVVRAYLPRQDVSAGEVTIQIVEARFGKARIGANLQRVDTARLLRYVDAAQPADAPVNADALDRAILLIDDLPGVAATGNLVAGSSDGQTDLLLNASDEPLLSGSAGIDNTASRSTGAVEATASVFMNSPLGLGDQLQADLVKSRGNGYVRLAYGLPVGSGGWRVGIDGSALSYRLVTAQFAALGAHGASHTVGANATYALLRARDRNLFFTAAVDSRRFHNEASGTVTSAYAVDGASAVLSGNLFDDLGGGGATAANLALRQGRLDLGGSPNQTADAASLRAEGRFTRLRYGVSRQQALTASSSLFLALAGQQAGKNLDSSERFYLGGAYGVRAYPANEGGGSAGQLANVEWRVRLPAGFGATAFYDHGHVTVNHDNAFAGGAAVNSYHLQGAGLAAGWNTSLAGTGGVDVRLTWARRIGSHPAPNADGSDQDGSRHKNRFWLTATLSF